MAAGLIANMGPGMFMALPILTETNRALGGRLIGDQHHSRTNMRGSETSSTHPHDG
jgi:hypothetical protein